MCFRKRSVYLDDYQQKTSEIECPSLKSRYGIEIDKNASLQVKMAVIHWPYPLLLPSCLYFRKYNFQAQVPLMSFPLDMNLQQRQWCLSHLALETHPSVNGKPPKGFKVKKPSGSLNWKEHVKEPNFAYVEFFIMIINYFCNQKQNKDI
eukprot:bmy_04890T0